MQKIVINKPGGYEQLTIEQAPDLIPQANEVLIEVMAIGINYADCVCRMGLYASSFAAVFLTAWFALFELAHPHPHSKVLIHSAAGGVGSALVQLAKVHQCEVTAVVGTTHKVDAVRQLD